MKCICGRELERCPYDFMGMPAYLACECGQGQCVHVTAQKLEEDCLREQICRTIPQLREKGPI